MRVLLDTCVISELRKPGCDPRARAEVAALRDEDTFLSVVTVGEIARGIELLPEGRRKHELERWQAGLVALFASRILVIDIDTVEIWGRVVARAARSGRTVQAMDGLIAATALRHGLTLVTRNVSDVEPTGVEVLNPWSGATSG